MPDESALALITMGGQAQVVTFALDELLAHGENVATALVLHLAPDEARVRRALAQLSAEFAGERYQGRALAFRRVALHMGGRPLAAIRTAGEAEAVWGMARDLLADLKGAGQRLHICLAGGPRLLALTLTSAALLQCDAFDRLWHLYTPREFLSQAREGAILHAPPEAGVRLVAVPLVPLGVYFPALRVLSRPGPGRPALDPAERMACAAAWEQLSGREREVLRALAGGLTPQEAAERLGISLSTLDTHKTEILAECRVAWGLAERTHLSYHFLRDKFGPWLAWLEP